MHSALPQFSSVEVIHNVGRVVSTAHLIRGDVLPTTEQVINPEKCCTMNEMAGERAIVIRGSQDWGICVGKWEGFVKGVPGVAGVDGTPDKPGVKGTPGIKGQPGCLSIKFFSLFGTREWKHVEKRGDKFSIGLLGRKITVEVDLRTSEISFPAEAHDVPEAIALRVFNSHSSSFMPAILFQNKDQLLETIINCISPEKQTTQNPQRGPHACSGSWVLCRHCTDQLKHQI